MSESDVLSSNHCASVASGPSCIYTLDVFVVVQWLEIRTALELTSVLSYQTLDIAPVQSAV